MKSIIFVIFISFICFSVPAFGQEITKTLVNNNVDTKKIKTPHSEMKKLRTRIKTDRDHFEFAMPKKVIFTGYRDNKDALSKITTTFNLKNVKARSRNNAIIGESEDFEIDINASQGTFYIVSKYNDVRHPFKVPLSNKPEIKNDDLFKIVEGIIYKLGINDAESCHLAYLGMQGKEIGGKLENPTMVSRKVFIDRTINEIPVLGNRLVLTFDLDGKFRKLAGRWTPINVKESVFTVDMNKDEIQSHVVSEISQNDRIFIGRESDVFLNKAYIVGYKDKLLSEMNGPQPLKPAWVASMDSLSKDGGLTITTIIVAPEIKYSSGKL